jgi:hypothetical protein
VPAACFPAMKNTRYSLAAFIAVAFLATNATAANVNGEAKRRANNATKIALMHPAVRPKFAATVRDLEGHGRFPYIVQTARTLSQQKAAKAAGNSKVSWSFHNAVTSDGVADALAADFVDLPYFWQTRGDFWLMLAAAAESHGLATGTGMGWGKNLKPEDRKRIRTLIARRDWKGKYKIAWDPGHVQVTGVTLAEARRGVRPYRTGVR